MLEADSNIHFIVNPASGADGAPLDQLKQYASSVSPTTHFHITEEDTDLSVYVSQAIDDGADLVAAYGGDGTVMEVANCLHEHDIPMGILAGGTGNVIAHELGIPEDPHKALDLIFKKNHQQVQIDAGCVADDHFLLRFGIGWEAEMSRRPSTEDKTRWGSVAYAKATLTSLYDLDPLTYEITLDDDRTEQVTGIACSICNMGNVGLYNINLGKNILPDDGLLDILIVQHENLNAMLDLIQNVLTNVIEIDEELPHYRAKKVTIQSSESQRMSRDGEPFDTDFPVTIDCVPKFISVIVPSHYE